jgi:hypothetical protein
LLSRAVNRHHLEPADFAATTLCPSTVGIDMLRGRDQKEEKEITRDRRLWNEVVCFMKALVALGEANPPLPRPHEVPADPEEMRSRGEVPEPPRIIAIFDNIDSYYHYVNYTEYLSNVDLQHLSKEVPVYRGRQEGITEDLPTKEDDVVLQCAYECHLLRTAFTCLKPWRALFGKNWRRIIPRDRHIRSAAMERRNVYVGSRLITEPENTTAGIHRILKLICSFVPSVSFDVADLPPEADEAAALASAVAGAVGRPSGVAHALQEDIDNADFVEEEEEEHKTTVNDVLARAQRVEHGAVDGRVKILIVLMSMALFGDGLSELRGFVAQLNTNETFLYRALVMAYANWHAIRLWDLKTIAAKFRKCQVLSSSSVSFHSPTSSSLSLSLSIPGYFL